MRSQIQPLVLNGSHGEGGAALFRTAIAMAALTMSPVRVHNIRGATRKAELAAEDLSFLRAMQETSDATVHGDELRSTDVTFIPNQRPMPIHTRIDVQEHEKGQQPGNAMVIAASLVPVLARAGGMSKLLINGETYNPNTLTFDAFESGLIPAFHELGLYVTARQMLAGFGYAGQGEVTIEVEPSAMNPIRWDSRGSLREISAIISLGELPESIGERGIEQAMKLLHEAGYEAHGMVNVVPSRGPGAHVTLVARYERGIGVAGAHGARGVRIEQVVGNAVNELMAWLRTPATVDAYTADQILLPCVLSAEPCSFTTSRITQRLITMAWVIKQFMPIHITITGREGEPGTISVSP